MRNLFSLLATLATIAAACGSDGTNPAASDPVESTSPEAVLVELTPIESTAGRADADPNAPTDDLVDGFTNIGFDLLRDQPSEQNAVLSPASIGHATLMLRPAADAVTGAAIDEALALPDGLAAHEAWNRIDRLIRDANGTVEGDDGATPVVTIADRIWPTQNANPDQEWVDLLTTYHGADVSLIDNQAPEASRNTINGWVSDQTQGLIPELIPPNVIKTDTTLVLTDAVYFEAAWTGNPSFGSNEFRGFDGSSNLVPFVETDESSRFGTGDGWTASILPYSGRDFSMLFLVPDVGRFDEIREDLSAPFLAELDASLENEFYALQFPQWEDDTNINLLPWLSEIGAAPGAYPGIGSSPPSRLGAGVHAADIAVDEEGTIAAAATALVGTAMEDSGEPNFTFTVDRPFFYLIRHNDSGLVLFAGQVTDLS